MYVKTFKGYEDRTAEIDAMLNEWVSTHRELLEVIDVKTVLAHEVEGRAKTGDLLYTVVYRTKSGKPIEDA